ncbi:MAG TPA: cyanophycin synthetase, partial [Lachnospiraceae bacterium]|nr:cyanophycin synthetase [Lachnospiraceae bacterium]
LQMLERGNVTIIDDAYNSNPVGSKAAVETLKMFDGLRILVTPGMVELGEKEAEYNHKFGTYAASCCDYVLLIGKEHTKPIYEGLMEKGYSKERCLTYDTLEEALAYAYTIKEDGHKFILLENDLPDNY